MGPPPRPSAEPCLDPVYRKQDYLVGSCSAVVCLTKLGLNKHGLNWLVRLDPSFGCVEPISDGHHPFLWPRPKQTNFDGDHHHQSKNPLLGIQPDAALSRTDRRSRSKVQRLPEAGRRNGRRQNGRIPGWARLTERAQRSTTLSLLCAEQSHRAKSCNAMVHTEWGPSSSCDQGTIGERDREGSLLHRAPQGRNALPRAPVEQQRGIGGLPSCGRQAPQRNCR